MYNINIATQDATGAPGHTFIVSLTVAQDFLLTSSTPSQTVNAGQATGAYNLTIQPVGASFNAAVTLTCSNLPALALCSFAPAAPVTPGNSAANIVMTISTTAATTAALDRPASLRSIFYAVFLLLPGIVLGWNVAGRSPTKRRTALSGLIALLLLIMLMLTLWSCGGVSNGGGGGSQPGTPPGSYHITVTGTSTGAPADAGQSTQVTLVVN